MLGAPMGSEQYIKQWCDRKVVVLLHKIAAGMELPREFAVEKFTAIVQGLRPKWTHAVARFYIAARLVAKNFCKTVQQMCDGAVMRIMGHGLQKWTNGASAMQG